MENLLPIKILGRSFLIAVLIFCFSTTYSQTRETEAAADTLKTKEHSPRKATIYSAILPGLGQIYNKKYWKVPIIAGGFATLIYLSKYHGDIYLEYLDHYSRYKEGDEEILDKYGPNREQALYRAKEAFRRYRDLDYILMFGLYVLNIIDASVDAHLKNFDIGDDLTLRVEPALLKCSAQRHVGFTIRLNF